MIKCKAKPNSNPILAKRLFLQQVPVPVQLILKGDEQIQRKDFHLHASFIQLSNNRSPFIPFKANITREIVLLLQLYISRNFNTSPW